MQGEDTRQRILAAARDLFAEKGYDGATTAAIAQRAGVAEGTIYRHFRDKKELFIACLAPALEAALDQGLAELQAAPDIHTFVRTNLAIRLRVIREHLESFNILFTEAPYHPDLMEQFVRRLFGSRVDRLRPVLERLQQQGELARPPNTLFFGLGLTAAIWAMLSFGGRLGLLEALSPAGGLAVATAGDRAASGPGASGPDVAGDRLLNDLVDFVLYGLAGKPRGAGPRR